MSNIKTRKNQREFVTAFLEVYCENGTLSDLCKKLDDSVANVSHRISRLRRAGVNLPKLYKLGDIDVDELNKLIETKLRAASKLTPEQRPIVVTKPDKPITPKDNDGVWRPKPIVPNSPDYGKATHNANS